ncbi:MAG TPA: UPF0175 family protein [Terriglobia bacterium]|nr:UPF0175 family protein [Terriglobia bacterium]
MPQIEALSAITSSAAGVRPFNEPECRSPRWQKGTRSAKIKGGPDVTITLELPEDIAAHLSAMGENLSRAALEAFGLEQYRAGKLTQAQLRRLLGFATRMEVDGFLKAHGIELEYGPEDLESDRQTLREVGL